MEETVEYGKDKAVANRRLQRQLKRDEEKRLRSQAFTANQKVTRAEMQRLMNAVMELGKEVSEYKGFVRNIFFVLDHKGVVTLKEMDEIAKSKAQELKDFQELSAQNDIPLSAKIEIAKQKGLSQVFIDMLGSPEQVQPVIAEEQAGVLESVAAAAEADTEGTPERIAATDRLENMEAEPA